VSGAFSQRVSFFAVARRPCVVWCLGCRSAGVDTWNEAVSPTTATTAAASAATATVLDARKRPSWQRSIFGQAGRARRGQRPHAIWTTSYEWMGRCSKRRLCCPVQRSSPSVICRPCQACLNKVAARLASLVGRIGECCLHARSAMLSRVVSSIARGEYKSTEVFTTWLCSPALS
jgi:hypothetical protein